MRQPRNVFYEVSRYIRYTGPMKRGNPGHGQLGSAAHAAQRAAALIAVLVVETHDDATAQVLTRQLLEDFGEPNPKLDAQDVVALRRAAEDVLAVFAAPDMASTVAHLNALLARSATAPRLTAHDGTPWHLHVDPSDNAPWGPWFVASSAMALAILASDKQRPPGGLCASSSCRRPFVDVGKGGGRRYCSPRCATRERVASHRRKQG